MFYRIFAELLRNCSFLLYIHNISKYLDIIFVTFALADKDPMVREDDSMSSSPALFLGFLNGFV